MDSLVTIRQLQVEFQAGDAVIRALDGADLDILRGEVLGIVGESGSGKSTLASAIGGLLPGNARIVAHQMDVLGRRLQELDADELRNLRRHAVTHVFQDPISTLDPTSRVEKQLRSVVRIKDPAANPESLLRRVGLEDTRRVLRAYPHELSGGMAQRVSIAMAMIGKPQLLIADEPTAALDASVRTEILNLLIEVTAENRTALVLLSHDLRAVSARCDRVAIMYAGRVVEVGPSRAVFGRPAHPYSVALLRAEPGFEAEGERIVPVAGLPPILHGPSPCCAFSPRCEFAAEFCRTQRPESELVDQRAVLCMRVHEVLGATARSRHV